jgi:hypothetical protein
MALNRDLTPVFSRNGQRKDVDMGLACSIAQIPLLKEAVKMEGFIKRHSSRSRRDEAALLGSYFHPL